jgi:hypothetical protein
MGAANWNRGNINPVMAGAVSSPGACVNLPVPTEESHFAVYQRVVDGLSRATHHATDRFEDFPARLKGFVSYSSQGTLADVLLDSGNNYAHSAMLPWNSTNNALPDLNAIFNFGSQQNVRQGIQKAFFARLLTFEDRGALRDLRTTDYDKVLGDFLEQEFGNLSPTQRREFEDVLAGYKAVRDDLQRGVDFRNQFLQQVRQEFNGLPVPHTAQWVQVDQALQAGAPNAQQQMLEYLVQCYSDSYSR